MNESALVRHPYKLVRGGHGRFENGQNVIYRAGDTIQLTDEEAAAFGLRVQRIASEVSSGQQSNPQSKVNAGDQQQQVVDLSSISTLAIPGVVDLLATMQDANDIQSLKKAEETGLNRKGVMDAVERRLMELS